jgi:hypothetical protein
MLKNISIFITLGAIFLGGTLESQQRSPITQFPAYMHGAIHPGLWALPVSKEVINALGKSYLHALGRMPTAEELLAMRREIASRFTLSIDLENVTANTGSGERIFYGDALKFLEDNYLKKPLRQLSSKAWYTLLLNLHNHLAWPEEQASDYRSQDVFIYNPPQESLQTFIEFLRKEDPKLLPALSSLSGKLATNSYHMLEQNKQLTINEQWLVQKYLSFPPVSAQVKPRMKQFIQDLQTQLNEQTDPIKTAAFAHESIARIQPFNDANGRIARLIMNMILMQAGYPPVIFFKDKTYTQAVTDELKFHHAGAFECYLRTRLEKIAQEPPVNLPILEQSEHTIDQLRILLKAYAQDSTDQPCHHM